MSVAQTQAQLRANKKYREKFEYLQARVPADEKNKIRQHAEARGESLNDFMRRAFAETMERDNTENK